MRPRLQTWALLLDLSNINHGLLLPILLHCIDDHGRALLGLARKRRQAEEFLRNAHTDIPIVVEANTGGRPATPNSADYSSRGTSHRLR
jgi:uncharacterized protein